MSDFEVGPDSVLWRGDGETLVVRAWGRDSLRVRATRLGEVIDTEHALLPASPTPVEVHEDGSVVRLRNGKISVELRARSYIDYQSGYRVARCDLSFHDGEGRVLLTELGNGGALRLRARAYRPLPGGNDHTTVSFEADPLERLFGMGLYQQELLNLKGTTVELAHRNSQASVPFLLSSRGYGMLWHNPAIGRATFGVNRTEWVAESTPQLDYWITAGDSPAEILTSYADATGHAPVMPEYGLGLWQSKLRYWNQDQLMEVAREYKKRDLPLDVIVADFFHWPKMGDFRFEDEFWPDPAGMVTELDKLGVKLMVSVWPQVSVDSENFPEFHKENLLARTDRGPAIQMNFQGPSLFADFTNPRTRERVWELCRRNYHDAGIELFWLDEAEPEFGVYDFDNYRYHLGAVLEVGNLYPQAFSRTFYEGQRAAGQRDIVNLVRCAWAGSQRYGALVWSGDIQCTFDALRKQVCAGLNIGLAGIPWFTTDIGGFQGGDPADPAFRELMVRWFQFATFCPVLRMHGDRLPTEPVEASDGTQRCFTGVANELWSFGPDVYAILSRYLRVREALRPYLRRLMQEAHEAGQPLMRPMFFGFPDDPTCWDLADQYLFGDDLLIAPVLNAGATTRSVYLPAGTTWIEVATGVRHEGGAFVDVATPLESIPVFSREEVLARLLAV